ncbi:MAG: hypothetical protein PHC88_06650 [Terrimicrobiaceae bacterium]|nr:hypothetical protein [Terrimicrobiaceae bacterium]
MKASRPALLAGLFLAAAASAQVPTLPGSTPNDEARFLSGLRVAAGSPLEAWQRTPEYLDHARAYATTWRKFDNRYFGKMRAFAARELAPRIGSPQALYYLFSGPDFINAYALFPDVPVYILVGLESVGSIVPPEQLDAARLQAGLANLRQSTSVTLQFGFFITKDMKVDLEHTDFKGVLPIIESFIALGGGEILGVEPFSPGGGLPGVLIHFRKHPTAPEQSVYYIRADLSDDGMKSRPALFAWMSRFSPAVSYLKAASYLLHEPYFSRARSFLLDRSVAILQDDSGLPLRTFVGTGPWQITFFGRYAGTLDLFKKYVQPDLAQAYQNGAQPLDFGTGYKWRLGESNLMLAVRQAAPPRAEPAAGAAPY